MTALPAGVERHGHGGFRVSDRPGWRWLPRALAALLGLIGAAVTALGFVLLALDVPAQTALLAGVVMLAGIPLVLRTGRRQQAEHWVLDSRGLHVRDGVTVASGSVPWERIAALELHDRRARLPVRGGSGPYTRLVTVTALDRDGNPLLRLPDENSPGRIHAVFDAARRDRLVPPHVRFVERA